MLRYSQRLPVSLRENAHAKVLAERRRQGLPLLDLTISNPTLSLEDYPHAQIQSALPWLSDFTYNPDPLGDRYARLAVCDDYYGERGVSISPDQIILASSTSEGYSYLFKLLCDPGDEILIPLPSYPLFAYLGMLETVRIIPYQLRYDGNWHIDFDNLRSKISSRTKAVIVVHPNNPTGTFVSRFDAETVLSLAAEQNLAVIADEVFSDYRLGSNRKKPPSFIGEQPALTFSLNGLSKVAGMPQMKLAWIAVSGPSIERRCALDKLEIIADTFLSVGVIVAKALPRLFQIGTGIRHALLRQATDNLAVLDEQITSSALTRLHLEGGWSAILRVPQTQPEESWVTKLIEEHGVVTQPGYFFDMESEAYLVLSLITAPEIFRDGLERLCAYVAERS